MNTHYALVTILLFMFTKSLIAQNVIDYGAAINYNYNGEKVYAGNVNNDAYADIVLYNTIVSPHNVKVLFSNAQPNSLQYNYSNAWDITLTAGEELWEVKDMNNDGNMDLCTKKIIGANLELYVRINNGNGFNTAIVINNGYSIPNANYTLGCFNLNNTGATDIYFYNTATGNFNYATLNAGFQIQGYNTLTIGDGTEIATHFLHGQYTQNTFEEICFITEKTNLNNPNNSNYFFQILKNTGGTLSTDFSLANGNNNNTGASAHQRFYAGDFTYNDNYTDIAVFPGDDKIYMIENSTGNAFGNFHAWQHSLTPAPLSIFAVAAGNFHIANPKSDMILLQTAPQGAPSLGELYIEQNILTDTFNLLSGNITKPCGQNPIQTASSNYRIIPIQMDNSGADDYILWEPSLALLKVGILKQTATAAPPQAYCWPFSASAGDNIQFYIKNEKQANITISQYISRGKDIEELPLAGANQVNVTLPIQLQIINPTPNAVTDGCQWTPSFTYTLPSANPLESGYFAAKITDENCQTTYTTFIVKNNTINTKKLALLANTNTWAAYNTYTNSITPGSKYGVNGMASNRDYSLFRPLSGTGMSIISNERPGYARGELWIYTWLKDHLGYAPDVVTDIDLHLNNFNLNNYEYFVMGTHPEYWTGTMYDHVKDFQHNGNNGNGGNLICIGGNAVFEVVDLDFTNPNNPLLKVYPNAPGGVTSQQNAQYPLPGVWAGAGGDALASPTNNLYDRFDFFNETYNFGTNQNPIYKRTLDLLGVHYMNYNSINGNNTSYTKNIQNITHPLLNNIGATFGQNGYCSQGGVDISGNSGASGWECERYTPASAPDPNTPASPIQTLSVYDNDIQILAAATPNAYSTPYAAAGVYCPNGMNNSEIIYVPPACGNPKRGFVFTAGSITFGGSLVYGYNPATQTYQNDLSTLMNNVLEHTAFVANIWNVNCTGANTGSITLIQPSQYAANSLTYLLMPNNVSNTTGVFTSLAAGTYTITVTATTGNNTYTVHCKEYVIDNIPLANFCCSPQAQNIIANTPNLILLSAPTASALVAQYGNTITGKTFYIDDVFTINQDITFNNCTLWFTPTGQVLLQGPVAFTTNNTVMDAACDWWNGIYTNDPQQKVIFNNATIQQMVLGVQITNDATIVAMNSSFVNNINNSISFLDYNNTQIDTKIENCSFMGSGLIVPFNAIYIQNCNNIHIGNANNIAQGNLFKDLQNGIEIRGDGIIVGIIGSNSNQINLYNNKFENIAFAPNQSLYYLYMNSIYNQPKGAGVYIDYSQAPGFGANTSIIHTGATTSATPTFDNCYKAIVSKNNNLQVQKQYINNADFGIMNYNLMSKEVNVQNNKIENAHIGTQLSGNYKNYELKNNNITINAGVEVSNIGFGIMALMYPAIGIDIKQLNPPYDPSETHLIDGNTIRIPYYAGKGIANQGANESQTLKNNNILFTVANGTPQSQIAYIDPGLYGIMNTNTKGIKLQSNLVDGQYSLALYNLTFSRGFYFETSTDMAIYCNKARATRQGLYAWGKNETDPKNIKNNKFKYNRNPLFTLDNGANQIGTFGNIGNGVIDNGNDWVYGMNAAQQSTWLQNGQFKVWRQSSQPAQATIYTDASLLTFSQSGSLNSPNADYGVDNNVTPIADPCPDPVFGNSIEPNNNISWSNMDVAVAEYLAQQQQTYIAYAEVGEWWNSRNLYERLSYDTALLNSSAILQSFYSNYGNSTIHELVAAGMGMQALFDFSGDSITLDALYNDALNHNYAANSNNDAELYEKSINEMILLSTRYGIDTLSEIQKTELAFIAHLCPFAAGPAVYKARTLNTLLDPMAQYNDRLMCVQNMGQNKNGNTGYINIDSLYEAEGDKLGAELIATHEQNNLANAFIQEDNTNNSTDDVVKVYPNPATTTVIIAYRNEVDGVFTLFNVLGEKVLQTTLSKINSKTQIPIFDIANGIYQYEIQFGTEGRIHGKLNIIK